MLLAHREEGREPDLSSIRCAVSAGESLPPAIFERFRARFGIEILDGIGSTEVLHIFISNRPGRANPGSSGEIVPGYEARLVDETGGAGSRGCDRSLMIRGDSTCACYWNKHEQTKDTIVGHWIRTGDQYYVDEQGFYFFVGRSDDMLKVGGIWVSPTELESVLFEHRAVQACGVVGKPDADGLVKPAAFIVHRPWRARFGGARRRAAAVRARASCRVQAAALGRVRRCAADDRDGQGAADSSCGR